MKLTDLGRHVLTPWNLGEITSPASEIGPIELISLSSDDAFGILDVSRPAGEQLVEDQVFCSGEGHGSTLNIHVDGSLACPRLA